jgi:hypothetical protein
VKFRFDPSRLCPRWPTYEGISDSRKATSYMDFRGLSAKSTVGDPTRSGEGRGAREPKEGGPLRDGASALPLLLLLSSRTTRTTWTKLYPSWVLSVREVLGSQSSRTRKHTNPTWRMQGAPLGLPAIGHGGAGDPSPAGEKDGPCSLALPCEVAWIIARTMDEEGPSSLGYVPSAHKPVQLAHTLQARSQTGDVP